MLQPNRTEEKVVWRSLGERARHPVEQGTSGVTLKICCLHPALRLLSDKAEGLQQKRSVVFSFTSKVGFHFFWLQYSTEACLWGATILWDLSFCAACKLL